LTLWLEIGLSGEYLLDKSNPVYWRSTVAKKKLAVHLFSRAVRLAGSAGRNGQSGRLEDDLLRYERKLRQLSLHDPRNEFFWVLERANLKLLRYIMRGV
jgi:hypothetical protein